MLQAQQSHAIYRVYCATIIVVYAEYRHKTTPTWSLSRCFQIVFDMAVEVLGISLSLTWLLALITLAAIVIFVMYDSWCHTYWKHRGIPFEPAQPIIGNMRTFAKADGLVEVFDTLQKKHGKVYGIFSSRVPVLVVGDPDMLRHITVKEFNKFHNRIDLPQAGGELRSMVSVIEGERWREVRNILTPSFSGSKMKHMSHLINNNADTLVKYIGIKQKEKGYVECQQVFGSFVMDTVGSCAFGLDIDSQSDPSNPFAINAKRAFQFPFMEPLFVLGSLIPPLGRLLANFRIAMLIPADVIDFFKDVNKKMIKMRKSGTGGNRNDFLQSLIDAQKQETVDRVTKPEEDDENDIHADLDKHHDVQYHTRKLAKKAPLTDAEVFGQTLIFFTAGAETTTTLLGFIFYALSRHPEVQEKLIDEIDKVTPSRDSVGYTSVASMPYLDQVVCETLRLYPPAAISNRVCNETFEYNGLVIEKGVQVFIPTYQIQHDPDYWPEPEKFDPGRFAKEERAKQHPFAWMPFGAGPRNCIGMRFALMETKMAVVRVLQNYRFETCAQTEIPPKFARTGFLTPPNGVTLKAIPRTDMVA